jgi:NADPH-dependent 2,4-dienoyl-CoA reductase/sulfur reductase-like enzyme/rhodanese-related sulfurtransferase
MSLGRKILIIGGVATGPKTAARCRRLDPKAEVIVIERQDLLSYAGCGLPYYIEDVIKEWNMLIGGETPRDVAYFEKNKGFKVFINTEAKKINRTKKTVTVEDLNTGEFYELSYDNLVIATGAKPFIPRIDGIELKRVHRLYNPHHAKKIKIDVERGAQSVAIVGGGLIGMETCGAFVTRGCKVTIFEMMPNIVPNLLDKEIALLLEKHLVSKGVRFVKGSPVVKMLGDDDGNIIAVENANGTRVKVDLVVIAIGVSPNTELAEEADLNIGCTGAIAVNEYLQTSDPNIFAGGDCVENTHILTGEKVFAPLGSTANKHGRIIANNLNGIKTKFPGVSGTAVFKVLDFNCGITGITESKALELGFDVVSTLCPRYDYSNYIPGAKHTIIKLIADKASGQVLGCQIVGKGDGVKRIDVIVTAMKFRSNLKSISELDLGYAPVYSTAIDAIAHAANVLQNKIKGIAHGISPLEFKKKLDSEEDFVLLDVRDPHEYEKNGFVDPRVINIPLSNLKTHHYEIPQDKKIITYCLIGVRAYLAERTLRGLGYNEVEFLEGSLLSYPFPIH